jgi:signal transduction histidine kinase
MKIEDAGHKIIAFLDSPKRGALADLRPDELLKIRAIVSGHPHFPEIRLWLPTSRDVESLGVASEVIARRVWMWVGVTAACIIPLLVWVLMLRRSRTAMRGLNAGLEKRVAERTTELEVAKDELSRSLSQERELNELKTRFISLVSHEFRTPLGITMSAVELIRHHGTRLSPEKQTELLEDIHSSTLRMSGLMEQVLILGRVEAGKAAYHPAPLNLEELCGKLTDEELSSTNRRCPVKLTCEGALSDVQADEGLIRHIFGNLLSNAVKYSPEGTAVEFKVHRENGHAVFAVRDEGIGIPEADQSRLFEAFHRASNVGEVPGTGLGLLLVKRCVDLHRGSIRVDSAVGKGTTFLVRLPVEEQERD